MNSVADSPCSASTSSKGAVEKRNKMEKNTETVVIDITLEEPEVNNTKVIITGMKLDYHNAAMKGNTDAFAGKVSEEIESMLTPNKNTILHIHLTNDTNKVSEQFVEGVLDRCPTFLSKTNVKDETILHIAARYGHHKIVTKLIDCAKVLPRDINGVGAEKRLIRAINVKKDTALHEAARYGHIEVVKTLIKEEPDQSYFGKNVDDETPLYIAVERRYWGVVDSILDNSKEPQYNGPNGRTALHATILHTYYTEIEIVRKLLERNVSSAVKEADENCQVPLHLAALCASSEVVKLLLMSDGEGITPYMRDNKGRIALHYAALRQKSSVMKTIIEHCPDCYELIDEKGFNALHFTSMEGNSYKFGIALEQILKEAPQMRSMWNEKDDDGNTALHLLARDTDKRPFVDHNPILRDERVDRMACNKYGQTAADVLRLPYGFLVTIKIRFNMIGARFGKRVLDKHLRKKKHDSEVDEEKKDKIYEDLAGEASTVSIVAILIATVAFTAAFTLPGGLLEDKGSPTLKDNAAFIAFVITDSLSFILSTCVVSVLSYSSMVKRFNYNLYEKLVLRCRALTALSIGFMIISFGTGLYAVLGVSKGFGIVILFIALSFFLVFLRTIYRAARFAGNERKRDMISQLSHML